MCFNLPIYSCSHYLPEALLAFALSSLIFASAATASAALRAASAREPPCRQAGRQVEQLGASATLVQGPVAMPRKLKLAYKCNTATCQLSGDTGSISNASQQFQESMLLASAKIPPYRQAGSTTRSISNMC
jgi:hypothetical protein